MQPGNSPRTNTLLIIIIAAISVLSWVSFPPIDTPSSEGGSPTYQIVHLQLLTKNVNKPRAATVLQSEVNMNPLTLLAFEIADAGMQQAPPEPVNSQRNATVPPRLSIISTVILLAVVIISFIINRKKSRKLKALKEELEKVNAELARSAERSAQMNDQLALAQRLTQIGSWEWDLASNKVVWSGELYRIYGVTPEDYAPSYENFLHAVHKDDQEHVHESIQQALGDHQPFNFIVRIVRPGGEVRVLHEQGEVIVASDGKVQKLAGTCHDITLLKEAEEKLKESSNQLRLSEQKFKGLLENAPDAIVIVDEKGIIQLVNIQAETLFGYSREEIVGKEVEMLMPAALHAAHASHRKDFYKNLQFRSMGTGLSLYGRKRNGDEFPVEISLSPIETEEGTLVSSAIRDITARKQTEDMLRATTRELERRNLELERSNAELESFSYIASHDLQEPLRKIRIFTEKLLEKEKPNISETGRDYFNRLASAAVRMQNLINDLLNYSRLNTERVDFQKTNLAHVVDEVKAALSDVIEKKNAVIKAQELPAVEIIPWQFQQLFSNLLSNSLKYSKDHIPPEVTISAEFLKNYKLHNQYPGKDYWKISVVDNGIGFEMEYNEKIFDLFSRLHGKNEYSGTGIGLAICKRVVENHNGTISAEGQPGVGSTFHIFVPETHAHARG